VCVCVSVCLSVTSARRAEETTPGGASDHTSVVVATVAATTTRPHVTRRTCCPRRALCPPGPDVDSRSSVCRPRNAAMKVRTLVVW